MSRCSSRPTSGSPTLSEHVLCQEGVVGWGRVKNFAVGVSERQCRLSSPEQSPNLFHGKRGGLLEVVALQGVGAEMIRNSGPHEAI